MLSFLLIIVLIHTTVSTLYYRVTTQYVQDSTSRNFTQLMNQTKMSLDSLISGVQESSQSLVHNETLQKIFEKQNIITYPMSDQLDDYLFLSKYLSVSDVNKNISKINLYFIIDSIYTREKHNFFSVKSAMNESWYERTLFVGGAPVWSYDEKGISCTRAVINYELDKSECGFIEIEINTDSVFQILNNVSNSTGGSICLVDDFGNIVVVLGANSPSFKQIVLESLTKTNRTHMVHEIPKGSNPHGQIIKQPLTNGWIVMANLPYEIFQDDIKRIMLDIIYIFLFAVIIATLLTSMLAKNLSNRINRMVGFMSTVNINTNEYITEKYNDEITVIETNFNQMLKTARASIHKEQETSRLKKEADFNVLQEQINPHFLYNCLDSINWMANEYHAAEISSMSSLLGKFYRLGLSNGKQIVSLSDEIEHMRIYLEIMKKRFDGQLNVELIISLDSKSIQTLKFILQPIVENAIIHGISSRISQEGHIIISFALKEELLIISIKDDGVGMDARKLGVLRDTINNPNSSKGFGLRNVNQRVKLHFGGQYGINLESEPDVGTTVIIYLPANMHLDDATDYTTRNS